MKRNAALVVVVVLAAVAIALIWWPHPDTKNTNPAPGGGEAKVAAGTPGRPSADEGMPMRGTPAPVIGAATPASATGETPAPSVGTATGTANTSAATNAGLQQPANAKPAPPNVQDAMIDLDKTRRMIRDYNTLMGENPVGTNAEIMKAIMGGNPRQATLGPGEGQQLNSKGELVDQWGTPYFFHQLSGTHMEIHSAGPDKIMGTDDDLVLK